MYTGPVEDILFALQYFNWVPSFFTSNMDHMLCGRFIAHLSCFHILNHKIKGSQVCSQYKKTIILNVAQHLTFW